MTTNVPYVPYDEIENNPFSDQSPDQSPETSTPGNQKNDRKETDIVKQYNDENQDKGELIDSTGKQKKVVGLEESQGEARKGINKSGKLHSLPERKQDKFKVLYKVIGLERVGSLSNKKQNPTILFDCSTNVPTFRRTTYRNLKKTTSEFIQLYKHLYNAIPESFIPTLPTAYTNYGINNKEDYDATVRCYQEWFDRIAADPLIIRNEELAFFTESDFDTYIPTNKNRDQISGLKRKTLKQLAPPYDEVADLSEFRPIVKSIYHKTQAVEEALIKICKNRKALSEEENAFGLIFSKISDGTENNLYKRYGKVMTAVGDINSVVATLDSATLYDGLDWIVRDSYQVKEALTNRHFIMRDLSTAQQNTKTKQEQARKLRSKRNINPLKVDEAIRNLKIATKAEQELTLKLQRTTSNMLIEKKQWIEWYEKWLKHSIRKYTMSKIEYERKKLTLLERARIDVRSADETGGLSRLGRSRITSITHEHIPSQTTDGDSWTGEARTRTPAEVNRLTHTEFDDTITAEESKNNEDDTLDGMTSTNSTLDAKNAAHMLGMTTF